MSTESMGGRDLEWTPGEWIVTPDPHSSTDDYCIGVADGKVDTVAVCSKRDAYVLVAAKDMAAALLLWLAYDSTDWECGESGHVGMMLAYADALEATRAALTRAGVQP